MSHAVGHVTPIEVLLLTDKGDGLWECLTRPGRKTRAGVELTFGDGLLTATVEAVQPDGNRLIRFHYEGIFLRFSTSFGTMPLPPYIKRKSSKTRSAIRPSTQDTRLGCRADRRSALYEGAARSAEGQGRKAGVRHAARWSGYVPPG